MTVPMDEENHGSVFGHYFVKRSLQINHVQYFFTPVMFQSPRL